MHHKSIPILAAKSGRIHKFSYVFGHCVVSSIGTRKYNAVAVFNDGIEYSFTIDRRPVGWTSIC